MGWRRYFRRRDEDAELVREIEAHLAHEADENVARGMTAEEAQRQARVRFGSARLVREDVWSWNTIGVLDDLWRDLRRVTRTLWRSPGFALAVILVMALGIGAVTAMFTIVRSVLLKPLPFGDPGRLVMLYEQSADGKYPYNVVAGGIYREWRKEAQSFEQMALYEEEGYDLADNGGQMPEQILVTVCSWNFFPTLGVQPALGRGFEASDDRPDANATVILSWRLWKRRFGGDPAIVGGTVQLEAKAYTVIGVMPGWFAFPDARTQAWVPVYHEVKRMTMEALDNHQFRVLALLKPGATQEQGLSEVDTVEKRIRAEHPFEVIGSSANIRPLLEEVVGDYRTPLYALLAATACVLVIACLNAANLFVARSTVRRKEIAIRSALGGSRWRLIREQLMESVVLSVVGGAIGLEVAYLAVQWVVRTRQDMARADAIHMDGPAVLFAIGIMLASGTFAGVISARSARNERVLATLQEASRTHSGGQGKAKLRQALLAIEMALTVVLLVGAGLLLKSYRTLRAVSLGCATDNVLTMYLSLPEVRYRQPAQKLAFFERLIASIRHLPGVQKAGLVTRAPGAGYGGDNLITIAEHPPLPKGEFQIGMRRFADPGYFEAMEIPLLRGRTFRDGERLGSRVVIISDLLAREYFPGEDPLGRHVRANLDGLGPKEYEIVGIVGDTKYWVSEPVRPTMYFPIYSGEADFAYIVVRPEQQAAGVALPMQKLIAEMDPDLAVSDVLTMDQVIGRSTRDASFSTELTLGFALLSLLLASVGLYGVLSYLVAQRTSEIGVRMALGALPGEVLRLTLTDGMRPAILGLVFGLGAGVAAAQLIRGLLYGVRPFDASVFGSVALVLLTVAIAACSLPAWRASRLDPVLALRME
jgi:predicted permease